MSIENNNDFFGEWFDNSKPVVVTGVNSYIGSHVAYQLLELGYSVTGTVRNADDSKNQFLKTFHPQANIKLALHSCDLTSEKGWDDALKGADIVIHIASPFPSQKPADESELIIPAVNGVKFVFEASIRQGVKRIVQCSSTAAVCFSTDAPSADIVYDEDNWTSENTQDAYVKSKLLAEKKVWEYYNSEEAKAINLEVVCLNPGFVLGPVFSLSQARTSTSCYFVKMMMMREVPLLIKVGMPTVDVRDVALSHIKAMTLPRKTVSGKRFILCDDKGSHTFKEIADMLGEIYRPFGFSPPSFEAPNWLLTVMSPFSSIVRDQRRMSGMIRTCTNAKARDTLKVEFKTLKLSLEDHGLSLVVCGAIPPKKLPTVKVEAFHSYPK